MKLCPWGSAGLQDEQCRQGRREGARADLVRVCPGAEGEPAEKEMMDNPLAASPATPARVKPKPSLLTSENDRTVDAGLMGCGLKPLRNQKVMRR